MRQSHRKIDGYYRSIEDVKDVFAVQILDPATGTGTFLRQIILQIYKTFQEKYKGESKQVIAKKWNEYVDNSLLPRINGFELMMAPYAVAHMKLAMVLKDTGYTFSSGQRLNVFLTNSLEKAGRSDAQLTLFDDPLAIESVEANAVKKNTGLNVIIGNPPYSSESSNRSEWIMNLMEDYKREPGSDQRLQERNYKAINDDYVKFVRMASAFLDSEGSGIIAYINNHAFIDNPTFRGMRWDLLQKCDAIYIMDLHGNIMRKEVAEDGSKDENVFDIQQGVSINFFIKKKKRSSGNCRLYHYDLFGTREKKYRYLNKEKFGTVGWEEIVPKKPQYFFISRNEKVLGDYTEGFSIQDLMPTNTACIVTSRDAFVISTNKDELIERIRLFADLNISDDSIQETLFGGKKLGSWDLNKARRIVSQCNINDYIQEISYRPFDTRFIFYHSAVVDRGREEVMRHMIAGDNIALIVSRQAITDNWSHVQITNNIADNRVQYSNKGLGVECPLYLYVNDMRGSRVPNLSDQVIKKLESCIKSRFVSEEANRTDNAFTPLDVLNYVYAVLNSNKYRKKYIEFLRTDFPRIPYPHDKKYFFEMAYLGDELRKVNTSELDDYDSKFQYSGTSTAAVDKAVYKNSTIYLNKNKDCIKNVPEEIWNHYYGGYQPVQKWLKDRKNSTLGIADINHLLHIITALKVNIEVMDRIDSLIVV